VDALAKYLMVALGGALGAILRFYLGGSILSRTAQPFPMATFVINITGSLYHRLFSHARHRANQRQPVPPPGGRCRLRRGVHHFSHLRVRDCPPRRRTSADARHPECHSKLHSRLRGGLGGIIAARKIEGVPLTSNAAYRKLEHQANATDPAQTEGAERDIRDASIEVHSNQAGGDEQPPEVAERT
jgi:hypothetical protein